MEESEKSQESSVKLSIVACIQAWHGRSRRELLHARDLRTARRWFLLADQPEYGHVLEKDAEG